MKPVIKLIFRLVFSLMLLLFINNPIEPLSIFVTNQDQYQWYPLFQMESVVHYQQMFTFLVLLGIAVAVLEYLFRGPIWEVVEDIPNIIGLIVIRGIPKVAFNFSQELLEKIYPIFYIITSILLLLAAVGMVLKIFNFVANQREGATKQK